MIEFVQARVQFGAQEIFRDVSLRILPNERVGVVGPNGAGKSTLFALITGELAPDAGSVDVQRGLRIGTVRQQLRPHAFDGSLLDFALQARPEFDVMVRRLHEIEHDLPGLTPEQREPLLREHGELQSRFEHLGGYTLKSRAEAALCGLGFVPAELERPFRSFSGGWQMRAELVRTLLGDPDLLLLDEPSNYLDLPAIEWLEKTLEAFQGTVLLVSHDRFLLRSLCQATVEVAGGIVTRYPCGYDEYLVQREERVRIQEAAARNQQKRRDQIERFVERFRAKNTKASMVQSRIKMLDKMEEIRVPQLVSDAAYLRIAEPPHSGAETLRLEGVGHTYDGARWVLRGVDVNIMRGDKIALVGFNGMGKTTLLRILAGAIEPAEGRRVLGHLVVPGYQSQDFAETMPPDQTVYRVVKDANPELPERQLRTMLGGFGFEGEAIDKTVDVLSGGEKIRLAFARLFARPPNLLLLDEPTTHLDIQGRQTLERALRDYAGTVVLVSHDVTFVRNVATNIIALQPPGIQRYVGDYDYYRERVGSSGAPPPPVANAEDSSAPTGTSKKEQRRLRADQRREVQQKTRALKKEIEALEKSIQTAEAERAQVLADMESGKVTSYSVVNQHLTALQEHIDADTARWEEASLQLQQVEAELAGDA
ncbi:MAG TPA: ABC-F family ATP-binding cassette domain-containing protein [Kiritimatiellia bacterium]|nr:ABC-F family ATP-binding cassette domain-containing protein [Kiritimatiellia bacterium]